MSSFFSSFGKNSAIKPNTPTVRKETRPVEKPKPKPVVENGIKRSESPAKPPISRSAKLVKAPTPRKPLPRPSDKLQTPPVRKPQKRKSASPSINIFGSSSEGESDDEQVVAQSRKRVKTVATIQPDHDRRIRDETNWDEADGATFPLQHGENLTSGEFEQGYKPVFGDTDEPAVVELQYPGSSQKERFKLMFRAKDEYDPLADIRQSIVEILHFYLPPSQAESLQDPSTGIEFRLLRAVNHNDLEAYRAALNDFNMVVQTARADGTMAKVLDDKFSPLPLRLVERILSQVYQHTVSPAVKTLSAYKPASDNVYGELIPPFSSQIFRDAGLTSSSVFLDLGSGVGNVVLQAALEFGAESWGMEMMANPAALADEQARAFPARCRMWGLGAGKVHLLRGDFREDERIGEVLRRADVVLINNQAFTSDLNARITEMLLDLKDGARVVSLKSFVPSGFKLTQRTSGSVVANLDVQMKSFYRGWVSWKDEGGNYFVAKKDEGRVKRFLEGASR